MINTQYTHFFPSDLPHLSLYIQLPLLDERLLKGVNSHTHTLFAWLKLNKGFWSLNASRVKDQQLLLHTYIYIYIYPHFSHSPSREKKKRKEKKVQLMVQESAHKKPKIREKDDFVALQVRTLL